MDLHRHGEYIPGGMDLSCMESIGKGTAIDSLAAIKHLIYDTKKLTWDQLLEAIECNWEGKEAIRQLCLNAPKYGNGIDWVDADRLRHRAIHPRLPPPAPEAARAVASCCVASR